MGVPNLRRSLFHRPDGPHPAPTRASSAARTTGRGRRVSRPRRPTPGAEASAPTSSWRRSGYRSGWRLVGASPRRSPTVASGGDQRTRCQRIVGHRCWSTAVHVRLRLMASGADCRKLGRLRAAGGIGRRRLSASPRAFAEAARAISSRTRPTFVAASSTMSRGSRVYLRLELFRGT